MDDTPKYVWSSLKNYYDKKIKIHNPEVILDTTKYDDFIKYFKDEYNKILNDFMLKNVETLDRHKKTAILIAGLIENKVLVSNEEHKRFIGLEQTALLVGLSYMKQEVNHLLTEKGESKIEHFFFPQPMSCDTSYFDILTRDLYFQNHNDNSVYILLLSHILFQIEYLTLIIENIDPQLLHE